VGGGVERDQRERQAVIVIELFFMRGDNSGLGNVTSAEREK